MVNKISLADLQLQGKKVLMRVDFNVPIDKEGAIVDDARIVAALPSIRFVIEHGGALILMSHLGRPKAEKYDPQLSLKPCATRLSELLNLPVIMAPDCVGEEVNKLVDALHPGQVLLLENLRFHAGEEHPEEHPEFVKALAQLGDVYVNDAFGTAHRAHASTVEVARYFPSCAAAGFLMQKELDVLGKLISDPPLPFHALIGGAKVSTKINTLNALLKRTNVLYIAGAMAFTFYKAQGRAIGDSPYEEKFCAAALQLLEDSRQLGVEVVLPVDNLIADKISEDAAIKICPASQAIPEGWEGVDIGPETITLFRQKLSRAATILWNGPVGIYEIDCFANGTKAIAKAIVEGKALVVVGGGDSVAAVQAAGVADKIAHLSTGGGATLEFLEFGSLPGIEALTENLR